MNISMHGKKIADVHFLEESSGNPGYWYGGRWPNGQSVTLELSATHHGDHDEFWIVAKEGGIEFARRNCKSIAQVNWDVSS